LKNETRKQARRLSAVTNSTIAAGDKVQESITLNV